MLTMPIQSIQPDISAALQLHEISELQFLERLIQWQRTSLLLGSCAGETVVIILHLIFLSSFLITFVWGRISQLFTNNYVDSKQEVFFNGPNKETPRNTSDSTINFGFIYKATLSCCFLLSASYFLVTAWDLLHGIQRKCNWHVFVVAEDILLTFTWLLISIMTFNIRKTIPRRLPSILRTWHIQLHIGA